ncbi:MAG TPA: hypothetical protein VN954_02665, partial [Ktedonobacteraceae bacterium]|nr:hypothetical protein [Ktedonobacteraceae bacterium]
ISLLKQSDLISPEESVLKRGEFVSAYRKFLEDHRSDQLKALKEDAWLRIYHLFALPESQCNIYQLIDPFRRGYFLARDLPGIDIKDMMVMALQDLAELEQQARQALSNKKAKHIANNGSTAEAKTLQEELVAAPAHSEYLVDYLKRNLEVWDSRAGQSSSAKPILVEDFVDSLRQYANPKRVHAQCCHCGSPLKASEWMAIQVPSNMGVQSFSNRLEGGSLRDPKRNVCDVCRMQFILEKLAWRSHGDKQGSEQVTFYLHLFPYAFFTKPLLEDWWERVETLGDSDHTAFFINVGEYFRHADQSQKAGEIPGFATNTNGIGKPALSEALSNTPILPIIAPGDNYGLQFMLALEKAIVLVRWFECRAILSRSPVPPLNLANERVDNEPAVLMIEGMPRNISWLLPQTILHRQHLDNELCTKLNLLYRIVARLYYKGGEFDAIPHDLAVAAVDDSLALYFEADRLIEKTAEKCNASPEQLTRDIAPLLEQLITLS